MKLGIMQGRLVAPEAGRFQSFPRSRWRDEFALAAAAGLDTIEWIYDAHGEDVNPLGTDAGMKELAELGRRHGVLVESVCADWFMDFPLVGIDAGQAKQRWLRLEWLMRRAAQLKINRIIVPFVDASALRGEQDMAGIADGINRLAPVIDSTSVELHLETSLAPAAFQALLAAVAHPGVKVNYDVGNSASLGFRPAEEFAAYGRRVGSVHIKDRRRGGGTVPLGQGDADLGGVFECLRSVSYAGDLILQAARGTDGDELAWTRENVRKVRAWMRRLEAP